MKAVFDIKPGSGYQDDATRYHFPGRSDYLEVAHSVQNDWVLFREPRRNKGRRAYVATARVARVEPDPQKAGYFYAYLDDYLEFPNPVPLVTAGEYAESPLRAIKDPSRVGQSIQGKSMRAILNKDFDAIVLRGLSETLTP